MWLFGCGDARRWYGLNWVLWEKEIRLNVEFLNYPYDFGGQFFDVLALTIYIIWKWFPPLLERISILDQHVWFFLKALLGGVWRHWSGSNTLELSWLKEIEEFSSSINMSKKSWKHQTSCWVKLVTKISVLQLPNFSLDFLRTGLRTDFCLYLLLLFSSQKGTPKTFKRGRSACVMQLSSYFRQNKLSYFPLP